MAMLRSRSSLARFVDYVCNADEVATAVGGTLVGSGATMIHAVAPLDRAGGDDLSFYAHARYAAAFEAAAAGGVF